MAKTRKKNKEWKIIISTRTFVEVSLYVYIAYVMLPFLSVTLPSSIRTLVLLYIMGATLVFTTFANMKRILPVLFLHIVTIVMITICYYGKGYSAFAKYISYFTNSYLFWGALVYAYTIQTWEDFRKRRMFRFLMLTIIITMVTTFIGNLMYPEASRILSNISRDNATLYLSLNIGPYGFIYGLVIMLPFFFWMNRRSKHYLLLIVLAFAVLFVAQYSLAILVATAATVLVLLVPDCRPVKIIAVTFAMLLTFVIFTPILDALLNKMREWVESIGFTVLSDRMASVSDLLFDNDLSGGALTRTELYMKSLRAWLESPLFGSIFAETPRTLGAHSEIFDLLGSGGLFGLFIFIGSLVPHIKRLKRGKETNLSAYKRYSFIIFVIIACFNTVFISGMISICAFLLPELMDIENANVMRKASQK